jgi:hypothetical protein
MKIIIRWHVSFLIRIVHFDDSDLCGIVQQPNKSTIPKQVHSNLGSLFEFRNFTSPLILRAANIVEGLLNKDDFFDQTIGAVLNKIREHYRMANLSREDLQKLREKILSGKSYW